MVTCVHHWLIGEPERGKAVGMCRKCFAERTFDGGVPVDYRAWKEIPFVTGIVPLRYRQWGDGEEIE